MVKSNKVLIELSRRDAKLLLDIIQNLHESPFFEHAHNWTKLKRKVQSAMPKGCKGRRRRPAT